MAEVHKNSTANCGTSAISWLDESDTSSQIHHLMDSFHVPGLTVAIIDEIDIHSRAFGHACVEPPMPCTPDTLFDIASCSKAFTAIAVAMLVASDDLPSVQWNSVMSTLLPDDFEMSSPEATQVVTIEDVLSHRSGLPSHDLSVLSVRPRYCDSARSVTRNLRHLALSKPPKSTYQYSNLMYTAATHLIETLTQNSFSAFLHDKLFKKLEMTSTFLQPSEVCASNREDQFSTPYYYKDGSYHETCHQETPEAQGAGSIQTSANDLAKLIRAMINQSGPITSSIYEAVTTPRITKDQRPRRAQHGPEHPSPSYALGWDVKYHRGVRIISHDGIINGYGSRMFFLPDLNVGAVILGNSDGAFDLSWIIQSYLVDEILDIPEEQRFDVASSRLKRFKAQETRREKNLKRNADRRHQAKGTLKLALQNYLGDYHNDGYRTLTVQERDGSLFVDGRDRSMPFTMLLEHVEANNVFRGYLADDTGEDIIPVRFRFCPDGQVSGVGMVLEPALRDDYFIWFNRTQETITKDAIQT